MAIVIRDFEAVGEAPAAQTPGSDPAARAAPPDPQRLQQALARHARRRARLLAH